MPEFTRISQLHCCGIKELDGLSYCRPSCSTPRTIEQLLKEFCEHQYSPEEHAYRGKNYFQCRFVIYSMPVRLSEAANPGDQLTAFIQQHNLGTVTLAGQGVNPNSNNELKVWLWTINDQALGDWYRAHGCPSFAAWTNQQTKKNYQTLKLNVMKDYMAAGRHVQRLKQNLVDDYGNYLAPEPKGSVEPEATELFGFPPAPAQAASL